MVSKSGRTGDFSGFECPCTRKALPTIGQNVCGGIMGDSYREPIAWRKATRFVIEIYDTTRAFPKEELNGLANQLRRAAVSVPSNIAEGRLDSLSRNFDTF
jgi:hypothetical protein